MIQKDQIETILKINGLDQTSTDEEIRSVLLGAHYDQEESQNAINLFRQKNVTNHTRIDGLHKVFRTDVQLKPDEISALLGIDVDVPKHIARDRKTQHLTSLHLMIITFLSIIIAVLGLFAYMYYMNVGLFHPSMPFFDRL